MRPTTALADHQSPDGSSSRSLEPPLPTEEAERVRGVFHAWVSGGAGTSQLRDTLRLLCGKARARRLRVEGVLVAFKTICRSVPEACAARKGDTLDDLIARAVTICIEEYYADSDRPRGDVGNVAMA